MRFSHTHVQHTTPEKSPLGATFSNTACTFFHPRNRPAIFVFVSLFSRPFSKQATPKKRRNRFVFFNPEFCLVYLVPCCACVFLISYLLLELCRSADVTPDGPFCLAHLFFFVFPYIHSVCPTPIPRCSSIYSHALTHIWCFIFST